MRLLVQRVRRARVTVEGEEVGAIGRGLLVYVGLGREDGERELDWAARRVAELRLFEGERGLDRSLEDIAGAVLVVSQFTLYADTRKGRRPSFTQAARPETAEPLFEAFVARLRDRGLEVATGRFQTFMVVEAENDGPLNIVLDSADLDRPRRGSTRGAPQQP